MLSKRPLPIGSLAIAKTIGMSDVACFTDVASPWCSGDNDIDVEPDELSRTAASLTMIALALLNAERRRSKSGIPLRTSLGPAGAAPTR